MIFDSRRIEKTRFSADIVIVGTGAAGLTLAGELDDGKRRIILVEAGGLEVDEDLQPDTFFESVGEPADEITDQFHALGGLTRYWTGRVGMLDPIDLAQRPWVKRSGWPLAWSELAKFEDRAMRWCGFVPGWQEETPPLAALAALSGRPAELQPYAWRHWAVGREKFQHWGKRVHKAFQHSSNVTVLLHAAMTGVGGWHDNRMRSCTIRTRDGREILVEADEFVLCCGGVESTRLLLNLADAEPVRFAGAIPMLGKCFMQHFRAITGTIEAAPHQSTMLQNAFNRFRKPQGQHFQTGVSLSPETQEREELLNAAAWIDYRRRGNRIDDFDIQRSTRSLYHRITGRQPVFGHVGGMITLDVEQEPCVDSRIFLRDSRDRNGMKEAVIDWRITPKDRRTLASVTSLMVDWVNRIGLGNAAPVAGVTEEEALPKEFMLDSHHHLGATRMSASENDGVVDPNLKVHGIANLRVCSGSVMPTGGHVNPTLSIVALAIRLADDLSSKNNIL